MKNRFLIVLLLAMAALFKTSADEPIWSIGQTDDTSIEFAPGWREELTFTVGKSVPSRDFAGHHTAWGDRKRPYTIVFALEKPEGAYELELEVIYRSIASQWLEARVNDKNGLMPLQPVPYNRAVARRDGNDILLCRERVTIRIDSSWLKPGENKVTLAPKQKGSFDYDSLLFRKAARNTEQFVQILPSIFFRRQEGILSELCYLRIPVTEKFEHGRATVTIGRQIFTTTFTNAGCDFGALMAPLHIPADVPASEASIELQLDGRKITQRCDFKPAKRWKLFVCPKVHNDVGYTDLQPHVNELDNRNTDTVLDILGKYPFYKFNFETSWLVENYLDCRPFDYRERLVDYAREGRAAVNAFYLNLMTGICTGEELCRALYYTKSLQRDRGSNFDFACLTDAPSHTWFLPTLLHDAGIKAFSNGSNQTRAPILEHSDLNENSPFWWEGMNGERILMWYARSYLQWKRLAGDSSDPSANFDYLQGTIPQFLARYLRDDYAPDAAMVYGAYVDNAAIPKNGEAEAMERWNREYEFPRLVLATDAEFFNYIEKNFAERLPTYRGDCGAYWEDGVGSTAKATTLNRRTQQILPLAETVASLATLLDNKNRYPAEDFRAVWKNVMFYDEHTWGAHNSIAQPEREFVTRQWEIKENYATRANLDARNLQARAMNRLCQQIAVDGSSIIAFNWQSSPRTEPLEVEIDGNQHLVELASGKPMPLDVVFQKDGYRRVRFLAEDVPGFGYKTYAIRHGDSPMKNEKVPGETIESPFYRVTIDPQTGAIKSLFDKTENRELADAKALYGLNQYLYVSGGENSRLLNHEFGTAPADVKIDSPTQAKIVENVKLPYGQRIVIETQAKNTPKVLSEYIVYEKLKRVDIVNTVDKVETRAKEAVYFAFPFLAGGNPEDQSVAASTASKIKMEYQIQNGWVRPNEDQMPGACREWFTPQNLVHVSDENFSIAWATPHAPLACFTDINRGKWPKFLKIANGHVYSYVMNNYWFTNYRATQNGRFAFRYSITSGRNLTREDLGRFDADTRSPVVAYPFLSSFSAHIAQADRPWPAAVGSFLKLNVPNLQLVTMKQAEDGNGFIVRLREVAGKKGEAELVFPALTLKEAHLCNGVEVDQNKLPVAGNEVKLPFGENRFITIRIKADGVDGKLAKNK